MDEELDLDLDLNNDGQINKNNRTDKRVQDLLEKRKDDAKLIEEANAKVNQALKDKEATDKELVFFKDFSPVASKYQGALEYQDAIKEKVMAGYTVEDATVAVLAKEGKFTQPIVQTQRDSPAGGSATNSLKNEGEKSIGEMTQAEKRAILEKELKQL